MTMGNPSGPNEIESFLDGEPSVPFRPHAYYDPDGDSIECLFSDENFYAERVDALVTVYYGMKSKEIVGSLIKGVARMLRETPGFRIEIQDGRVRLEHVLSALLWSQPRKPSDTAVIKYRKLREKMSQAGMDAGVADLQAT